MIESTDKIDPLAFQGPDLPKNGGAEYSLAENASAPYFRKMSGCGAYFLRKILLHRVDNRIMASRTALNRVVL